MAGVMSSLPYSTAIDSASKIESEEDKSKYSEDPAMLPVSQDDSQIEAFAISHDNTGQIKHERPTDGIHLTSAHVVDFNRPIWRSTSTQARTDQGPEQVEERLNKISGAMRTILECIGEDPDREGLVATPRRYAKLMLFLTKGYEGNLDTIVNNALFHERHSDRVVVRDIEIHSLCEHHLLPFYGKMHIGYMPSDSIMGLSKLPRLAEMFSRRLQIQERLTGEVAHAIMHILRPRGVAVIVVASHLCMAMRGVQKTGATTVTSCSLGCFENEPNKRDEFLSHIGMKTV